MDPGLYIIPTPIGNLEDITLRAIRYLKEAEIILAEDTRNSGKLLKHLGITTPMQSFHAHNEHHKAAGYVQQAKSRAIALISDAGTPGISDPGFLLVRACTAAGVRIECLPGATAFVPALILSGLPADSFLFEGFLPHKKGRQKKLKTLAEESRTIIFYESPYRLVKLLGEIVEFFGAERPVSVSRELTKLHEENFRGSATDVKAHFESKTVKGEIVVVVGPEV